MIKEKLYWHQLPDSVVDHLFDIGGITWGDIVENYSQPPWCQYPQALNGALGCWSLVDTKLRHTITAKLCERECEHFRKVKK
jgi:hypothetical protein